MKSSTTKEKSKNARYPFNTMGNGDYFVFKATNTMDGDYRKVYFSALRYRRHNNLSDKVKFLFPRLGENRFGCLKVYNGTKVTEPSKNPSIKAESIKLSNVGRITKPALVKAMKMGGGIKKASKILNTNETTVSILLKKFDL